MFSTITWEQYFFYTGFALAIYYAVVAMKYFSWELLAIAGIHKEESTTFSNVAIPTFSAPVKDEPGDENEIDMSPVLQDFRDEIAAYLSEAMQYKLPHEEVFLSLQSIIEKYPVLNSSTQKMTRNDVISQELKGTELATIRYQDL